MNQMETELLEFAVAWAPYGGNDDEAFVRFGLSSVQFHARLLRLLHGPAAHVLTHATRAALHRQCSDRLRHVRYENDRPA
ncbi:hypothetical protein B7C42_06614 [Nocardia cerradoensis]|uniref:DUF3263 domain-containing protein n=2 Tax=Nocardia cerradoensis TaxID=85688 RepID=A0A231GX87_9NOCA|nr:hypothetical protein B7C42_06614 [Nocardia cerradoensis]